MEHIELYTAEWCGPCEIMKQRGTAIALTKRLKIKTIDVDEHPEKAQERDVKSIPTLLVVNDEEVTHRFVGIVTKAKLRKEI